MWLLFGQIKDSVQSVVVVAGISGIVNIEDKVLEYNY